MEGLVRTRTSILHVLFVGSCTKVSAYTHWVHSLLSQESE